MSSRRVEGGADAAQRRHEIGKSLEGEVLAMERDQHSVRGDERVQRQQAERWRAVDDDEPITRAERLDECCGGGVRVGRG